MAGWHHWFNGHELGQTPGDGKGQGALECYSPWGRTQRDMSGWLNNNNVETMDYLEPTAWLYTACTEYHYFPWKCKVSFCSHMGSLSPLGVQFHRWCCAVLSCSVMSDSLRACGEQHTRLPCPSPHPGVCSNSCPLNQWCHPAISSFVIPFFFCPQSFPTSRSFPISRLFASGGQRIGASASVRPMNIQGWSPLGLTGLISLLSKGLSRVFSSITVRKHQFFSTAFFTVQPSHLYMTTGCVVMHHVDVHLCTIAVTLWTFVSKVMPLFFNTLSRFVIPFLPRSRYLLISCLQSPSSAILEPKKIRCHFFPFYLPGINGTRCNILVLLNVEF